MIRICRGLDESTAVFSEGPRCNLDQRSIIAEYSSQERPFLKQCYLVELQDNV